MLRRNRRSNARWSMYPSLHDSVAEQLEDDSVFFTFHGDDSAAHSLQEYDTNIMGKFFCTNDQCATTGWSSKMVAITIRRYSDDRYNARVYHQRCKSCNAPSKPVLDDSYADRVAYRLKKWSGVEMEAPHYSGQSNGPHERELCEGCRDGHCSRAVHR